jgi:hypothetical protein
VLPADLATDVHRVLADLRLSRLPERAWPAVAGDLGLLAAAVGRADPAATERTLRPLGQVAFEGKVRRRLAGAGSRAALVTATKRSSALPVVGAVCGALLLLLGYLIGGWPVFLGTAVFALFVFGVALAGTMTNAERTEDRLARRISPTREALLPPPPLVVEAVSRIESMLTGDGEAAG